jgi:hypothetical protein
VCDIHTEVTLSLQALQFQYLQDTLLSGNTENICEISGSYSDKYEDDCLLGCWGNALMMEAVSTSDMSVSFYQST